MLGANLAQVDLGRISWGKGRRLRNHVQAVRLEREGDRVGAARMYTEAEEIYRTIRQGYESSGHMDISGEFFYLEMVTKRMQRPLFSFYRAWSKLVDLLCGYGEFPQRIIGSSIVYISFNAVVFGFLGMVNVNESEFLSFATAQGWWDGLRVFGLGFYLSVATFTTVGYGDFVPAGWARAFAATESFNGYFLISLFVLAFVKKMSR